MGLIAFKRFANDDGVPSGPSDGAVCSFIIFNIDVNLDGSNGLSSEENRDSKSTVVEGSEVSDSSSPSSAQNTVT